MIYKIARLLRDIKAVSKVVDTGSPKPVVKRAVNKWVGRNIVSKMWWR